MQKSMIHSDHMVPLDTLEGFRIRPGSLYKWSNRTF